MDGCKTKLHKLQPKKTKKQQQKDNKETQQQEQLAPRTLTGHRVLNSKNKSLTRPQKKIIMEDKQIDEDRGNKQVVDHHLLVVKNKGDNYTDAVKKGTGTKGEDAATEQVVTPTTPTTSSSQLQQLLQTTTTSQLQITTPPQIPPSSIIAQKDSWIA